MSEVWVRTQGQVILQGKCSLSSPASCVGPLLEKTRAEATNKIKESEVSYPFLLQTSTQNWVAKSEQNEVMGEAMNWLSGKEGEKEKEKEGEMGTPFHLSFLKNMSENFTTPVAIIEEGIPFSITLQLDILNSYSNEMSINEMVKKQYHSLLNQIIEATNLIQTCHQTYQETTSSPALPSLILSLHHSPTPNKIITSLSPFGILPLPPSPTPSPSLLSQPPPPLPSSSVSHTIPPPTNPSSFPPSWAPFRRSLRHSLHTSHSLPLSPPTFHPSLSHSPPLPSPLPSPSSVVSFVTSPPLPLDRLLNIHKKMVLFGKERGGVVGGKMVCVKGNYLYYHYFQDKFDDKGWGCAYRSLQTLCSWILLQRMDAKHRDAREVSLDFPFLEKKEFQMVPSHQAIQKSLVSLGDKKSNFVNSKQWIGALELTMVIDHLYGVTCRVIHVNSGAEVPSKAREFAHHFETTGSPIMIGGGVLAYTMLGVDWNEATGDIKYLILDPHYVGADDPATIINKGWCGWKDSSLFLKDRFYNFCLPLCPDDCY